MITNFKKGMKVRIKLPQSLPDWATASWRDALLRLEGQILTIEEVRSGRDWLWADSRTHPFFFSAFKESYGIGYSALVDWLEDANSKQPCNCSLSLIVARGCQNKGHI